MINKPKDWDEVAESEVVESSGLPVGAYPCQIKNVIDIAEKEYLEIQFDIVKGDYTNYFIDLQERLNLDKWPNQGIYRASYKETATKFFKAFITAIQKSNQGYVWNWNPETLKGKYMIANFAEEEYEYEGDIKTSVKVREIRSIEAWKAGDVKELPLKKLRTTKKDTSVNFDEIKTVSADDLPF